MRALTGRAELCTVVAARFGGHPWARVCAGSAVPFEQVWETPGAVLWRSGHPWTEVLSTHALGRPGAVRPALRALDRTPGEELVLSRQAAGTDPGAWFQLGLPHRWTLRLRNAPCPPQPGEERVGWLTDADQDVRRLLTTANPDAAVRPGDPLGGRWCGVYDETGLIACAVETRLAAPRAHLSSLAVHPRARRRGLGAAVTAWFTARALQAGAPEVLLAVDAGNERADRVYDALGFDAWPMVGFHAPPTDGQ